MAVYLIVNLKSGFYSNLLSFDVIKVLIILLAPIFLGNNRSHFNKKNPSSLRMEQGEQVTALVGGWEDNLVFW